MTDLCVKILRISSLLIISGFSASAEDERQFDAKVSGFQVVPPQLNNGKGAFKATLNAGGTSLSYSLTFSGLGIATSTEIHFAQPGVVGPALVRLCGEANRPCPIGGKTATGTITAADVTLEGSTNANGLKPGDFAGLLRIIQSGTAYIEIHDAVGQFVRGQIRPDD